MRLARKILTTRPLYSTQTILFSTSESSHQQHGSHHNEGRKVDFGFQDVNYDEKERKVGQVFSSVAEQYDLMNDLMSMGVHRCWKESFVQSMGPLKKRRLVSDKGEQLGEEPIRVLDVAGGTGDISFRIYDKARKDSPGCKWLRW